MALVWSSLLPNHLLSSTVLASTWLHLTLLVLLRETLRETTFFLVKLV